MIGEPQAIIDVHAESLFNQPYDNLASVGIGARLAAKY